MSLREHGVRVRDVLTAAVAAAAIAYLALTWSFRRDATLPPVSWAVALVLIVVCVGLALAGRRVRATVRQTARRPLEPLAAYRVLRLAQACALTGGLVAGGYLAYAAVALPDIDASSVRAAALSALAMHELQCHCQRQPFCARIEHIHLMKALLTGEAGRNSVRALLRDTGSTLALRVTDNAARSGEHYITESRSDYYALFLSAFGSGLIIAIMTLQKIFIMDAHLPALTEALLVCLNYALGFVFILVIYNK